MLSEKRAKSKTTMEKNLYKLLANSIYGKFVETGLKRMKVKLATTWNEREAIIQKYGYDMIAWATMFSENLISIKLNTPVRRVVKPFFFGFTILALSKHTIYDFYYKLLKNTFDNGELLRHDTDSFIVQLSDKGNIVHKMCEIYKSFDFSELDNTSYFYGQLEHHLVRASSLCFHPSSTSTRSYMDPFSMTNTMVVVSLSSWYSDPRGIAS